VRHAYDVNVTRQGRETRIGQVTREQRLVVQECVDQAVLVVDAVADTLVQGLDQVLHELGIHARLGRVDVDHAASALQCRIVTLRRGLEQSHESLRRVRVHVFAVWKDVHERRQAQSLQLEILPSVPPVAHQHQLPHDGIASISMYAARTRCLVMFQSATRVSAMAIKSASEINVKSCSKIQGTVGRIYHPKAARERERERDESIAREWLDEMKHLHVPVALLCEQTKCRTSA